MKKVNIAEAKARLSEFLKLVEEGETIIVSRRNHPVAEIRPVVRRRLRPRPVGLCAGEFRVPDDFDQPLPENVTSGIGSLVLASALFWSVRVCQTGECAVCAEPEDGDHSA